MNNLINFVQQLSPKSLSVAAVGLTTLLLANKYFDGPANKNSPNLKQKVVLITGGNTGIGFHTAVEIARLGATIILACRDQKRGNDAVQQIKESSKNNNIYYMSLDLNDQQSVRAFANEFNSNYQQLDILINNAGIMALPKRQTTVQGIEKQFGVNHIGHFLLTNLLLPKLQASSQARIINVSSLAHEKATINFDDVNHEQSYQSWKAYQQSKLSNILFTRQLHNNLQQQNIQNVKVVSLHPGVVRTELGRYMFEPLYMKPVFLLLPIILPVYYLFTKSAWYGAQTSLYCALIDYDQLQSGKYYSDCRVKQENFGKFEVDQAQKRLWEVSLKLTQ